MKLVTLGKEEGLSSLLLKMRMMMLMRIVKLSFVNGSEIGKRIILIEKLTYKTKRRHMNFINSFTPILLKEIRMMKKRIQDQNLKTVSSITQPRISMAMK